MATYAFTAYFETEVLRKQPYLRKEWCIRVLEHPLKSEAQEHNRYRFWGRIDELARIIHEKSVHNPGLHSNGQSRGGMTHGGGQTGYPPRVPRDECGVEMPQGCLIHPGPPITRASVKPALFARRVRE